MVEVDALPAWKTSLARGAVDRLHRVRRQLPKYRIVLLPARRHPRIPQLQHLNNTILSNKVLEPVLVSVGLLR